MIAEVSFLPQSTAADLGWLIVGIASLCTAGNQISDWIDRRKDKPGEPPNQELAVTQKELSRRVQVLEETIVEKEWFVRVEREIETMRQESAVHRETKDRTDSIHRSSIYKAIDGVRTGTASHIEGVRKELASDIKDVPDRLVALLKNTGAI